MRRNQAPPLGQPRQHRLQRVTAESQMMQRQPWEVGHAWEVKALGRVGEGREASRGEMKLPSLALLMLTKKS